MTMESDLRTFVIADGDVAALVGTRMFPQRIPQGQAMPAIRYNHIATTSDIHLGGVMGAARTTMQIDCYAETYEGSTDLAEKVRVALVADNNGSRTMGSTVVSQTILVDGSKGDEAPFLDPDGGDKWRFNRTSDYQLDYTEAAPA